MWMLRVRFQFCSCRGLTISHHLLLVHHMLHNCRSSNPCRQYYFLAFVGAYYSLSCEPTLGENQIFHSMVKRQVMKTRDAIKLIGDGQAQKLKKDKVIESWIKVHIGTVREEKFDVFSPFSFVCFSFVFVVVLVFSLRKLRRNYAYIISKTFCQLCTLPTLFALCTCVFFP